MKNKIMNLAVAMLSVAFLQTGCSEEDFPQPQQSGTAGTLHIASISINGQQVKSRAVADDGNQYDFNEYAYNQSLNSFDEDGDELVVEYKFGGGYNYVFINYKDGTWSFTEATLSGNGMINTGNPITIVPGEGKDWEDIDMVISSNKNIVLSSADDAYASVAKELGIVQGNVDKENIRLAADFLYADSEDGSLTVDTDIKSPTLGAVSATLKHGFRALLRLPESDIRIDAPNTYLVNGQNYSVTGLATLWAVMTSEKGSTFYYPFTQVGSNLQSIIRLQDCPYLTGFKAVLYTTESGQPGDEGYDATKVLTLDLPLKAGTETSIKLEENYMYPLTLNISPNSSSVTLSGDGLGKPGWGEDEDETTLDNSMNEAKNELSYTVSTSTFSVSGPNGLTLLNKWMTEGITTEAFQSAGFTGADDIPADVDPLAQNITFTADITLPAPKDGESNWTPVGKDGILYTGTIDGAGKTLTGMVINSTDRWQGFVGVLGEGGKVQNLTFNDAQVTGEINTAIVVGRMLKNSTVENCHTTATSSVKSTIMDSGGLVGYNSNGIITRCSNAAQVEGPAAIGGIVGENYGIVSACTNSGAVSADVFAGGIVGHCDGSVIACGNTGTVNGNKYVGGILGSHNEGNVIASWTQDTNEKDSDGIESSPENGVGGENGGGITACYVFGSASAVTAAHITTMNIAIAAWNATDGNIAVAYGWQAATSGQWPSLALITELSQSWPVKEGGFYKIDTDYYTAAGVKVDPIGTDFYIDGTDYYTAAGVKVEGFELADGTASVSTANALLLWNALAQTDLDLNLTLKDNITLPEPAEGGSNWTPVGNISTPYTGTIDGGGHTLTGMVINSTENNQGFVGNLGEGGKVQNLTFANATVISSSGFSIGIVVGNNMGTVENCHTTDDSSVEGFDDVGGIVGYNWGLISACINSSAVSATVEKDPWDGSVSRFGGVGGIVGDNYGDVIACGNTGTVNGKYNLGGIVGRHDGGSVIASWTQDTNETDNDGNAPSSTENGVGNEASGCIITGYYVFGSASDVAKGSIPAMNAAIEKYNNGACLYRWEPVTGGYPTLKTVTE